MPQDEPRYRGMNRAALDVAYDNVAHVGQAKRDAYVAGWLKRSEVIRQASTARLDVPYGAGSRQRLDILPCGQRGAPTLAYIHGGYWQWNVKERDAFLAEGLLAAGFNLVMIEYTLAPEARIDQIVDEVRRAVAWVIDHSAKFGGDPKRVVVAGHSAGGHLAAMAMTERRLAGGIAISGIFEMEPIRLSGLNDRLALTPDEADRNSPLRHLPAIAAPFIVTVGLAELPELVRQSDEYAAARRAARLRGGYRPIAGCDHFSILEELARPGGAILTELTRLVADGKPVSAS